ncbi:thiamine phosphate synthase [Clostridium ljungdahlii]|uniref:Thiamine-phosphate synthase n=1 Tax=Clostridium ljungdahlii TaxID=1538 RepID=A0A170NCL9_9CLOT|nr:thiamine phosphate synthase [Clostridium ljungdahlii]OAA84181.1 Regulatory protein TenI [Clostridium ljungdahlii]
MNKKLYIVTNRKLVKNKNMIDILKGSILGGADAIILREKDLTYRQLVPIAEKIKKITDSNNIPLIINNNIETALKIDAKGFHTGYQDYMNSNLKLKCTVGVSVHNTLEAINAQKKGADYLLAGHIFKTDCKKGLKGRGISFLKEILNNVSIPVIAIGGITEANIDTVLETNVRGAAVMSLVMASDDPFTTTYNLKKHFKK